MLFALPIGSQQALQSPVRQWRKRPALADHAVWLAVYNGGWGAHVTVRRMHVHILGERLIADLQLAIEVEMPAAARRCDGVGSMSLEIFEQFWTDCALVLIRVEHNGPQVRRPNADIGSWFALPNGLDAAGVGRRIFEAVADEGRFPIGCARENGDPDGGIFERGPQKLVHGHRAISQTIAG